MIGINDASNSLSLNKTLSWLAMAFFTVAQLSDIVDGYYARKYGVVSSFGKFIDPLADKLLAMAVLIMLIPLYRIQAWMVVLLTSREVMITALRSIAASEGVEIAASHWGKWKTVIQSVGLGALLVNYPFWGIPVHSFGMVLIWLTLLISFGSGIHYTMTFYQEVIHSKTSQKEGG
jgi:CDP-diacylglycerol--glycerol-3-phosphate 3-phosphatidyltransferase